MLAVLLATCEVNTENLFTKNYGITILEGQREVLFSHIIISQQPYEHIIQKPGGKYQKKQPKEMKVGIFGEWQQGKNRY